MTELAAGAVIGRWIIERPLSSGGMGTVYVAKHAETGRPVALKVIKVGREVSDELASRFRKETGALAAVSHPNVVTFLDSGVEDGRLYLVMELLSGRGLRSIMNVPVEPARAYRICADVCRALAAVHEKAIVHRDLKPENIFLVDAVGHDEIAKLIDFGIARLEDASTRATANATVTGAVVGTPGYISPEQLRGDPATVSSDVYAVGVMLYELVTGKFPFAAPTTHAMLVKQLMDPLPSPRSVLSSVPEQVERDILALMEREPAKRVRSAKDALAVLTHAVRSGLGHGQGQGHGQVVERTASLPPEAMTEAGTSVTPFVTQSPSSSPSSSPPGRHAIAQAVPTPSTPVRKNVPSMPILAGIGCLALAILVAIVVIVGIVAKNNRDNDRREFSTREQVIDGVRVRDVRDAVRDEAREAREAARRGRGGDRFIGRYDATYEGTYQAIGMPAPAVTTGTAKATAREGNEVDIVVKLVADATGETCEVTLRRDGDTATFDPPQQSCTFMNPDGSRQTNTNGGRAVLQGKDVVMSVSGSFIGAFPNGGAAYSGNFSGTWHLERTK